MQCGQQDSATPCDTGKHARDRNVLQHLVDKGRCQTRFCDPCVISDCLHLSPVSASPFSLAAILSVIGRVRHPTRSSAACLAVT